MIYVDQNKIVDGRAHLWRVFADTAVELREARTTARARSAPIMQAGEPNEHVILTSAQVGKLKGTTPLDMRGLTALIRRKRERGEILTEMLQADEASGAFDAEPSNLTITEAEGEPVHRSDCAIYNGPAFEPGPCDCGAADEAADASDQAE